MADLENVRKEYDSLIKQLSSPELVSDWEKFETISKRKNFLEKVIEKNDQLKELKNRITENKWDRASKSNANLNYSRTSKEN